MQDAEKFDSGVRHFNGQRFFEAHEIWEELWLAAAEPEKTYLQGLIQIAAAFHHFKRDNPRGAQSLLAAGAAKLESCPETFRGISIPSLRCDLGPWRVFLRDCCAGAPELPRLRHA